MIRGGGGGGGDDQIWVVDISESKMNLNYNLICRWSLLAGLVLMWSKLWVEFMRTATDKIVKRSLLYSNFQAESC